MGEFDFNLFLENLWKRENMQGFLGIENKGGYYNGTYHPYKATAGVDVGPGFLFKNLPVALKNKAKTVGLTKEELDSMVKDSVNVFLPEIRDRIIQYGGNPDNLSNEAINGMLDMRWQLGSKGFKKYKDFLKAAAKENYKGMREHSRTTYVDDKTGVRVPDTGRWEFRKETYFQTPMPKTLEKPEPYTVPKYDYKNPEFKSTAPFAEGGFLQPRDAWDRLSIPEKAEMMKVAVSHGIYNLNDIRQKYNEFAEGGGISDKEYYSTMEKVAEDNYQNWGLNSPDEALVHALNDNTYNYRGFYDKYPQSEANATTHWTDEFKTVYHHTFSNESIYNGQKSQYNPEGLFGGHWIGEKFVPASWQKEQKTKGNLFDGASQESQQMQISPYRYVLDDEGKWNRVTNDEEGRIFQGLTVTPKRAKRTFVPARIDNSSETIKKRDEFMQNRDNDGNINGEKGLGLVYPEFDIMALSPVAEFAGKYAANKGKQIIANAMYSYPALYQYPRYAIGKFKYGFDAELPTLYRKVKALPKIENGRLQVSNPDNRFAFDNGYGEESPLLTNMTTDAPVRSHSAGSWDRALTLSFPGKTLMGKRVISTQPSDTFVFGDNISVPLKDVIAFTGRKKELDYLTNKGVKTITSPEAETFFESGVEDFAQKAARSRAARKKVLERKAAGESPILMKVKNPIDDFSNYARTIEDLTRETFRSPTLKDYQFMDYVFKPSYTSQTMPVIEDITMNAINKYPILGEWVGNTERLRYIGDPTRWQNVMYDPLSPVESEFRSGLNIGLKPK